MIILSADQPRVFGNNAKGFSERFTASRGGAENLKKEN
jgi:hypothetical protein